MLVITEQTEHRDSFMASIERLLPPLDLNDERAFIDTYQNRAVKDKETTITFSELLEAVRNSEKLFEQYPVDVRNVNKLLKSIFIEDEWLMQDPLIACIDSKYYLYGGRHRVAAIAKYFDSQVKHYADKRQAEYLMNMMLVRVEITKIEDEGTLLRLIQANNASRIMRKPELYHLQYQALGGDAGDHQVGNVILNRDILPSDARHLSGQAFVRRSHPKLQNVTKQQIAEYVGAWILYDKLPGDRLNKKLEPNVNAEAYNVLMDIAWDKLCEIVEGENVLGRNARQLALEVIEQVKEAVAETAPKHQELVGAGNSKGNSF